ncbi:MAG: SulP family inorganic anion transporter [Myxococcota bacterium]|nr:SulP family inorganic anion transporter [Myxococcota bacterium]
MSSYRVYARADLFAGMSTAIVMMPQAMAYSLLAGLNPIHGLYAATVPIFVYAALGTSAHISIAPVAILAIMHGMLLSKIPSDVYLEHSLLLTAMVGALLLFFWLCRLGRLIQLISHSLIEGFITGAALLTALTQLPYMLGLDLERESLIWKLLPMVFMESVHLQWATLMLSVLSCGILLMRYWKKDPPYPLIAVLLGGFCVFKGMDTASVGSLEGGIPLPKLFVFEWSWLPTLLLPAFLIAMISYVGSIALAKHFAAQHRYSISPNRELLALGTANLTSALFGGFAVGAGFSRSAVHEGAGAKTRVAGLWSGVFVLFVLIFLSQALSFVPYAVLASIVFMASLRLVQVSRLLFLWRHYRRDSYLFLCSFFGVLFIGIELGLGLAIILQVLLFPWGQSPSRIEVDKGTVLVHGHLNYVNIRTFLEHVENLAMSNGVVEIDCRGLKGIDATTAVELGKLEQSSIRLLNVPQYLSHLLPVEAQLPNAQ